MSPPELLIHLIILATASGALSMWMYKIFSPQERMTAVALQLKETQRRLLAYDGEFAGAQPLILESLKLSLLRLGMVLIPSLLAAAPILAVLTWGMAPYDRTGIPAPVGWEWLGSGEFAFLLLATVSAIAIKMIFRVKC